ncbi:MAG: IclR family transcriptional regulator [Thermodesulfobacteriota bacterium]|nr:IclR family transcriptional regulator [Thermodesulfobacteriota bacterium]
MNEKKKYFFISSLSKGLDVLELLADKDELSVSEVARFLGYNRTGSHRLLATLRELGYVEQNQSNKYHLTFKMLGLGMKLARRFEIRRVALSYMQELFAESGETVNLGIRDGFNVMHLEKIDSREILRIDIQIGSSAPLYCTALGKSILAFLPQKEKDETIAGMELKPMGPNTITSKKKLIKNLDEIKTKGYAKDNEELASGLRCLSAPVFDRTGYARYSISISGPATRLTDQRIDKLKGSIIKVCRNLSKHMENLP